MGVDAAEARLGEDRMGGVNHTPQKLEALPSVPQELIDLAIQAYRKGYAEIVADERSLPDLYGYPMARVIEAVLAHREPALDEGEKYRKPVAWRVKDFADGWIVFDTERSAQRYAEGAGNLVQPLYAYINSPHIIEEMAAQIASLKYQLESVRGEMRERCANVTDMAEQVERKWSKHYEMKAEGHGEAHASYQFYLRHDAAADALRDNAAAIRSLPLRGGDEEPSKPSP